ncbi:MAG TPA: winged helix-turn-helix domain-containing protein, partial [Pyrinomonadaceae bacterium]
MSFESLKDDLKNPEVTGNGLKSSYSGFYEFGDFRLDAAKRLLMRQGAVVPLTPKALDVLLLLVSRQAHVVGKDELLSRVWPDTIVEENNLNVNVSLLRKTLGEKPNDHQFIVTVPGVGYQFVAEVRIVAGEKSRAEPTRSEASNNSVSRLHVVDASTGAVKTIARPTSNASFLVKKIKRYETEVAVAIAVLIIVGSASFGWYKFASRSGPSVKPAFSLETMKIARLTSTGKANQAAISPDGSYVVHVMDDAGQQSLWLRQVATATSNVQIVEPADVVFKGLTFSRDGKYVYYVKWDKKTVPALYQMGTFGGVARSLVVDIDSAITFSPDDRHIAFFRGHTESGHTEIVETALIVADSDGRSERQLAVRKEPDFFPTWFDARNAPAWSLDGKVIACPAGRADASGRQMTVVEVNVADGSVKPITSQRWWQIEVVEWVRNGGGLVLNAKEQSSSPFQIWYLSYPDGEVHRITNDLSDYRGMSLTADSNALVAVQSDQVSNISIARTRNTKDAKQLTSGKFDGVDGISWTPDEKIVYASRASGNLDIWIMNRDGSNQKQLTADAGNNRWQTVSADGRYIVFTSDRTGTDHIWRMNIDGSSSKQLTTGNREGWPVISQDGEWVLYNSLGNNLLWKVSIDGGEPVQVINRFSGSPAISPDGKLIASFYWDEVGKVAIYPFAGGQPIRSFEIWNWVRWT